MRKAEPELIQKGDKVQLVIGLQEGIVTDTSHSRVQVQFEKDKEVLGEATWWFDRNWVRKVERQK